MNSQRRLSRFLFAPAGCALLSLSLLAVTGCSGGTSGDRENRGPFRVSLITTGSGQIFPYRIREADPFGNPTPTVLNIEDLDILKANATANNQVLPVASYGTTATLPGGGTGNQFLLCQFSHRLDIDSIINSDPTNSGLTSNISLLTYDPGTEATSVIPGRGFVGGYTYYGTDLVQAVAESGGSVAILDNRAQGFPLGFTGDVDLVSDKSFVFVPDGDSNLLTPETFPTGVLLRIIVSNAVRDTENQLLEHEVCTATTVGTDTNSPDVLGRPSNSTLSIVPGNSEANVDPATDILVRFNKPVQPTTVGEFFSQQNLVPTSGGMTLAVTVEGQVPFNVTYYADPLSFGDFCNYTINPSYNLPGRSQVAVTVNNTAITGLNTLLLGNQAMTDFSTMDGPGIVNAPVAPEAIYVGVGGASPGVSVIDLNGLGQGTGDPAISRFPLNPNVGAPGVAPALAPTTTADTVIGGSAGALTLTQDSNGETLLLREPLIGQVGDIQVGPPLDLVFNNENVNINASRGNQFNPFIGASQIGNTISIPPHPNPPRLRFPPPNQSNLIFGEEPTRTSSSGTGVLTVGAPPCQVSPINLLTVGNPFGTTKAEVGLFATPLNGAFVGPQPPPPSPPPPTPFCPFASRQQIGHFLYVLDRDNRQVLIVNSNRMTVLDTIRLTDPFDMAVSPSMTKLAVSNFSSGSVSFIDINPLSPTFHTVVGDTRVDPGPTQVVYQPDAEDVLVLSTTSNTMTLINGLDFSVRKVVSGFLNAPVDVVATERYTLSGNLSTVYYAYILNGDGTIAVYESGPDGVNGFGFNDIIATVPNVKFERARKLRLDYNASSGGIAFTSFGAIFVSHVDDNGVGQISRLALTSTPVGLVPIQQNQGGFISPPTFRQKEWTVVQRFGGTEPTTPIKDVFSGNTIVDMCTDEIQNFAALPMQIASNVAPPPWGHSGKGAIQPGGAGPPFVPRLLFAAVQDAGVVDIFDLGSGQKLIEGGLRVPGVRILGSYWRQ